MNEFSDNKTTFWRLSKKVSAIVILASFLSAVLVGGFAFYQLTSQQAETAGQALETLAEKKTVAVRDLVQDLSEDLGLLASVRTTERALFAFNRAWYLFDGIAEKDIFRLYRQENPHPEGQKALLERANGDTSLYTDTHALYHPWYRDFVKKRGYEELYLVDKDGNVVYSVNKLQDFASNLNLGALRDTPLGEAFREGMRAQATQQTFIDLKEYSAFGGRATGFVSQPVYDDGEKIGVLVLQFPLGKLNEILSTESETGKTVEGLLIGEDRLSRNQSSLIERNTILSRRINAEFVRDGLSRQEGVVTETIDNTRKKIAYRPIEVFGKPFVVAVMQDADEAGGAGLVSGLVLLAVTMGAALVVGLLMAGFANRFTRPLSQLVVAVKGFAGGSTRSIDMQGRADELGELARALQKVYLNGIENTRVRAALDTASTCIMIADNDRVITYMNKATRDLLNSAQKDFEDYLGHFNVDNIMGQSMDNFHKNPHIQADIVEKLKGPYEAKLEIGDRTFRLTAAPIKDDEGMRLGSVVEWMDMTENLSHQQTGEVLSVENDRISQALDNTQSNVLVTDASHKIIFVNETMMNVMKVNQQAIRQVVQDFDVNNVIGFPLEKLHHNPEQQAQKLDNLDSTYAFHMQFANKTFDCVINPIRNAQHELIGMVMEWKDISNELLVQREVDSVVRAVAAGDFSKDIKIEGKEGFMLSLAQSINKLKGTVSDVFGDVAMALSSLAKGNLSYQIEKDYEGAFEKVKQDANSTMKHLRQIVNDITIVSNEIASASTEIASGSSDLSQRTENQASSLEETAASMEEMATTVNQNADNAQQANSLAISARTAAEQGGDIVDRAVSAMSSIEESSEKVSDIIGVIDEIAFQTNLLALNAAVEAARAGEAGKGFAVVAQEVRTLAQRSGEAAKDIKKLILESNTQVHDGVELVGNTGQSLNHIVESVKQLADIVSEMAAATREQASGVGEINAAITQMDEMTQQNAALVEESSASARSLEDQSEKLMQLMSFFAKNKTPVSSEPQAKSEAESKPKVSQAEQFVKRLAGNRTKAKVTPQQNRPLAKGPVKADTKTRPEPKQDQSSKERSDDADWEEF